MPKEEKITRKEGVRAEVAPSRSVKKLFSIAHERATRAIVSVSLAAALASCSPAVSQAQDTTPAKGKPTAAAVEKEKTSVQYTQFDDASVLKPYIETAKNMIIPIEKLAEYIVTTNFVLLPMKSGSGVDFQIWTRDDSKPDKLGEPAGSVPFSVSLDKIAVLDINTDGTVPFAKGNILALVDYNGATYYYRDAKGKPAHNWAGRLDDNMRPCSIVPGIGLSEGGVSVFPVPENLGEYPFLVRADLNPPDGTVGSVPLQYTGPKSTLIARNY